uniref:SFRICE_009915 n=1 Tax=Spodoptera frugiperda TaxID=7108 RepID=A0A2H1VWX5_SPOFR
MLTESSEKSAISKPPDKRGDFHKPSHVEAQRSFKMLGKVTHPKPYLGKQLQSICIVGKQTDHLMVSNRRRPWTPETPEASQLHCRPLTEGDCASSNLTHTAKHNAGVASRRFSE